jgi:hypothetical protein
MNLYIDPYLNQLVRSPSYGQAPTLPNFVRDDLLPVNVYFVDTALGTYIQVPVSTLRLAIGSQNQFPTGGTFTLTFNGQTTPAQPYNVAAATLQTALQALTSIGVGNCTVIGSPGQLYAVTFMGALAGASQPLMTTSATSLIPTSEVYVSHDTIGATGINDVQAISMKQTPPVLVTNFTALPSPNYGYSASVGLSRYAIANLLLTAATAPMLLEINATDMSGNRPTYVQQPITISDDIIGGAASVGGTSVAPFGNFSIAGTATNYTISIPNMTATGQISLSILPSTGTPSDQNFYQDYSVPGQVTVSVVNQPGGGNSYNLRWTVERYQ